MQEKSSPSLFFPNLFTQFFFCICIWLHNHITIKNVLVIFPESRLVVDVASFFTKSLQLKFRPIMWSSNEVTPISVLEIFKTKPWFKQWQRVWKYWFCHKMKVKCTYHSLRITLLYSHGDIHSGTYHVQKYRNKSTHHSIYILSCRLI